MGAIDLLREVEARYKDRFVPLDLPDKERIAFYIRASEKDTFFCDNPHIIALAHCYNVSVEVYNTVNKPPKPLELVKDTNSGCLLEKPDGVVRLHYDVSGAHYNAIVAPLPSNVEEITTKLGELKL